ncbi:hypothetical protein KDW10_23470 [Burkholderia vietnamiensis]|uniref:hypothetical protein n=1 Tax=Burkholderia vietnamiensis TaxID=60552 RepID=UPI001B963668|nr:hypothetical protein [Burkholderia vietnamiensis]MBR8360296.1 hypothetical protein [Burkholderia vietnamiensis]
MIRQWWIPASVYWRESKKARQQGAGPKLRDGSFLRGHRSITKAVFGSASCVAIACIRTTGGKALFTTMTPQAAATATITE